MGAQDAIQRLDGLANEMQRVMFLMRSGDRLGVGREKRKQTAAIDAAVNGLHRWREKYLAGLANCFACALVLCSLAFGATTNTLTSNTITWTFNGQYTYGTFANGDYWVQANTDYGSDPNLLITAMDPCSTDIDDRVMHGSMIDPNCSLGKPDYEYSPQGFDEDCTQFVAARNDGRPGGNIVASDNPIVVPADSSLVSVRSATAASTRPTDAAVLTVLTDVPDTNSFRPTFMDGDKTIDYNVTDLDYSILGSLSQVGEDTPALATVEALFAQPWLDFQGIAVHTNNIRPSNAMDAYGTSIASNVSYGLLSLQLDYTNAQKKTLMIRMTQLGIDLYGIIKSDGRNTWKANGAWFQGRKGPIVFAGAVLDDADMLAIGDKSGDYLYSGEYGPGNLPPDYEHFQEDTQTFYVKADDVFTQPYPLRTGTAVTGTNHDDTGTVAVTKGSRTVTGSGTSWLTDLDPTRSADPMYWFGIERGDNAYSDAGQITYPVDSVDSDTQITLSHPYCGDTNGTADYAIQVQWVYWGAGSAIKEHEYNEFLTADIGLPCYGIQHALTANNNGDGNEWGLSYQTTNSKNYAGMALPFHIMGLTSYWNHDAFFDYTDRWMEHMVTDRTNNQFEEDMWDAYRADYGDVWTIGKRFLGVQ